MNLNHDWYLWGRVLTSYHLMNLNPWLMVVRQSVSQFYLTFNEFESLNKVLANLSSLREIVWINSIHFFSKIEISQPKNILLENIFLLKILQIKIMFKICLTLILRNIFNLYNIKRWKISSIKKSKNTS